jgi:hypothetical protein
MNALWSRTVFVKEEKGRRKRRRGKKRPERKDSKGSKVHVAIRGSC